MKLLLWLTSPSTLLQGWEWDSPRLLKVLHVGVRARGHFLKVLQVQSEIGVGGESHSPPPCI